MPNFLKEIWCTALAVVVIAGCGSGESRMRSAQVQIDDSLSLDGRPGSPQLRGETAITTSVTWTAPHNAPGFEPVEPYTPLWHFKGSTYYVWVGSDYRAWVLKLTGQKAEVVPLDANPDYKVQPDGHHNFSMGIDKDGYLHITGDMHHYIDETLGVVHPYPARYQRQTILYWKSKQAESVSGGFEFAGGRDAATAIPGGGWLQGRFFTDRGGELYYSSQVHAYESLTNVGQMAVGLYRYDSKSKTWSALGANADHQEAYLSHVRKVIFWEKSGLKKWFQNYQATINFDEQNHMHLAVATIVDSELGPDRVIYASSSDGGVSWKKANGQTIPALPIRAADGQPNQGEVAWRAPAGTAFAPYANAMKDEKGVLGLAARIDYTPASKWWTYNGQQWGLSKEKDFGKYPGFGKVNLTRSGGLLFSSGGNNQVVFSSDFAAKSHGISFAGFRMVGSLDAYGLATNDEVRLVGVGAKDGRLSLVLAKLETAYLPKGWAQTDIDFEMIPYYGTAAVKNKRFVTTSYGSAIDNNNDSFHFIYQSLTGDGEMTARVLLPDSSPDAYSRAGLMMRASLDANSPHASILLTTGAKAQGALFSFRSQKGGGTLHQGKPGITAPYWLRLVRRGNEFTSFISANGSQWSEQGKATIAMPATIHLGLAGVAYSHRAGMQQAIFEEVKVNGKAAAIVYGWDGKPR